MPKKHRVDARLNDDQYQKWKALQKHFGENSTDTLVALINSATLSLIQAGDYTITAVEVRIEPDEEPLVSDKNAGQFIRA